MAAILDKYAIKEVADVMFYELDSKGAPSAPVIYFDTLKVSTISQSSEKVDARGGKSNVKLLTWDTNKEITLELEDAVFSAKSLGIMFGGDMRVGDDTNKVEVLRTLESKYVEVADATSNPKVLRLKMGSRVLYIDADRVTTFSYTDEDGKDVTNPVAIASYDWDGIESNDRQELVFVTFNLLDCRTAGESGGNSGADIPVTGIEINIGAEFDSNTYYITGDTYARNLNSGRDEFLQFIIPKGKVSAEDVSITMEADGDPATFTMNVDCLKSADGSMLKFVKYNLDMDGDEAGFNKGVASVTYEYENKHDPWADPHSIIDRD